MNEMSKSKSDAMKPYIAPKISRPEVIGIVPLAAIAATTLVQMAAAGALVGGAAAVAAKAMGISEMNKAAFLQPVVQGE